MSCCKIDSIHTGQPLGTILPIGTTKISTYITFPQLISPSPASTPTNTTDTAPKHPRALLLLSEVHGILLPNVQLLADAFASQLGCPVLAPNLFGTDPFPIDKPPGWDDEKELADFQLRHHPGTVDPILEEVLDWIERSEEAGGFGGVGGLGAVGYCFGGRYVLRLLAAKKIDAGVVNHPSFFTVGEVEALGKRRIAGREGDGQIAAGTGGASASTPLNPIAIFAAEEDDIFPESKRRATEDALKRGGVTWWCSVFGGTEHGFRYVPPYMWLIWLGRKPRPFITRGFWMDVDVDVYVVYAGI